MPGKRFPSLAQHELCPDDLYGRGRLSRERSLKEGLTYRVKEGEFKVDSRLFIKGMAALTVFFRLSTVPDLDLVIQDDEDPSFPFHVNSEKLPWKLCA